MIRRTDRDAVPDSVVRRVELIGTEFHRWIRDREQALGLKTSGDFTHLVERDFAFCPAASPLTPRLECIFCNAQNNFTLQYPVILATLQVGGSEEEIVRKLRIAAIQSAGRTVPVTQSGGTWSVRLE